MTIKDKFDDPYDYARATMTPTMTDREASIYMDACVSNWDEIKERPCFD